MVPIGTGYISGTNMNLCSSVGISGGVIGVTANGDTFTYNFSPVLNQGYYWYNVRMTSGSLKGKTGYLVGLYLKFNN